VESNLVLTGFMGTGKTSVGRLIAERLKRTFVDTDVWIEEQAGKAVSAIFAEEGEDRFRAWEAEACVALSEPNDLIIATGGWTLGPAENRAAIERGGRVICLTAEAEAILSRLKDAADRPLLESDAREARVRALLTTREPLYRSFAWQIDTTEMNIPEVMLHVMAVWNTISSIDDPAVWYLPMGERGTSIQLGVGLLNTIGPVLRARGLRGRAAVVADSNVAPLYGDQVARSLALSGFEPLLLSLPAGEETKSLESARALYEALTKGEVERGDLIVALGGGVVGDLAGFVAATYLRGLRWVCVPTSLLSMVDASLGGKVGVNLPAGKNLIGAFHPPLLTISDMSVLHSLPPLEFRSGLAEMIKSGLIADPELFAMFERAQTNMPEMIRRAIDVKVEVVRSDPFERNRRAVLNLGHTIGHGLEAASNYSLRHGEAIGLGLIAEAKLAERIGLAQAGLSDRIEAVADRVELPTRYSDLDLDSIVNLMRADKKRQGGHLRFALPRAVGDVALGVHVKDEIIREVLSELHSLYSGESE
jgi:shikimate kinase/3-dehydroquinate synthase